MRELLNKLEETLDEYLVKKAPFQIPENGRKTLVDFMPWIILIFVILSLPILLGAIGLGTLLTPFAFLGGINMGFGYIFTLVLTVIAVILEVLAIPGLMKKQMKGWRFAYCSTLVTAVESILSFNIIGFLIGTVLSLYILFQIKSYYSR